MGLIVRRKVRRVFVGYFRIFGVFLTRLGFLGIRVIEFCYAACAVGCVSEFRASETLNHAKRLSNAMGKAIQLEACLEVRPELRLDVRD